LYRDILQTQKQLRQFFYDDYDAYLQRLRNLRT